ncbi:MAG: RES family NAD+ phosphorylase [Dehalococcoidia bacterium]
MANQPPSSGTVSARLRRGTTGRSADVLVRDQPTRYREAELFAQALCRGRDWTVDSLLSTEPTAGELRDELLRVRRTGIDGRYFRARPFAPGEDPSCNDFGPPPDGSQASGRYSLRNGASVLYLGRTASLCAAETQPPSGDRLLVQELAVRLPDIGAVFFDTDLEKKAPALHGFLLATEVVPQPESAVSQFQNPYAATQFLAALAISLGIHAIEYPSVRGRYAENPGYVNLVVLPPHAQTACAHPVGQPVLWQPESSQPRTRTRLVPAVWPAVMRTRQYERDALRGHRSSPRAHRRTHAVRTVACYGHVPLRELSTRQSRSIRALGAGSPGDPRRATTARLGSCRFRRSTSRAVLRCRYGARDLRRSRPSPANPGGAACPRRVHAPRRDLARTLVAPISALAGAPRVQPRETTHGAVSATARSRGDGQVRRRTHRTAASATR